MTRWKISLFMIAVLASTVSFGQMGWNNCFFKIFYEHNKLLLDKDTTFFSIYNLHTDFKKVKYKGVWTCPDSCWSLSSNGSEFTGHYPEENVVFHPIIFIIKKVSHDTMQIYFNYVVHGFENGTPIPIVNEIIFIPGRFEVYSRVTQNDWIDYPSSKKIKKIQWPAKQPKTATQVQTISRKDTSFINYKGDSVVRKSDTTFIYLKNGCLSEKGIWDYKDKMGAGKWIGKHLQYYDNPCGQIFNETLYDNSGRLICSKKFDKKGKLVTMDSLKKKNGILDSLLHSTYQQMNNNSMCPSSIYFINDKKLVYYAPKCNYVWVGLEKEQFHPDTVSYRVLNDTLHLTSSFTKEYLSKQPTRITSAPFPQYWFWTFNTKQEKKILKKIKKEKDTLSITIYRERLLYDNTSHQKISVFVNDSLYYARTDSMSDNKSIELIDNFVKKYPDTIKVKVQYDYFDSGKFISTTNTFYVPGIPHKVYLTATIEYEYQISPCPYQYLIFYHDGLYQFGINSSVPVVNANLFLRRQ